MPWKANYTISDEVSLGDDAIAWPDHSRCCFNVVVDLSLASGPQGLVPSDLTSSVGVNYFELSGTKSVIITATNGWLGGTAVDVAMPAFSGLAGWSDLWAPASAGTAQWTVTAIGGTLAGACTAGTVTSSTRQGQAP